MIYNSYSFGNQKHNLKNGISIKNFMNNIIESNDSLTTQFNAIDKNKVLTDDEFEEYMIKQGLKYWTNELSGSFLIFRSKEKNQELGIDNL